MRRLSVKPAKRSGDANLLPIDREVRERQPKIYGDALHHLYVVTRWEGGEPSNVCDEHTELRWFSLDEMRQLTDIADCDYPRFAQEAVANERG